MRKKTKVQITTPTTPLSPIKGPIDASIVIPPPSEAVEAARRLRADEAEVQALRVALREVVDARVKRVGPKRVSAILEGLAAEVRAKALAAERETAVKSGG